MRRLTQLLTFVFVLTAMTPFLDAQTLPLSGDQGETFVFSSITVESSGVTGECGTQPDETTLLEGYGILANCSIAVEGSTIGSWACESSAAEECFAPDLFSFLPGDTYTVSGVHTLGFPFDEFGDLVDPLGYAFNQVFIFGADGNVVSTGTDTDVSVATMEIATTELSVVTTDIEPPSVNLGPGLSEQFTSNNGLTWSISPAVGQITQTGLYTAPASIESAQTVTVTVCGPSNCPTAQINLTPISVTLATTPTTPTLNQGQQLTVDATVHGSNSGVTWSITPPQVGTFTSNSLQYFYTAPAPAQFNAQQLTLTATNTTDNTKTASVQITLTPAAIAVNPIGPVVAVPNTAVATMTAQVNGAMAPTSGPTWSVTNGVGSINASTGVYTAPATALQVPGTALIQACLTTNPQNNTQVCLTSAFSLQLIPAVLVTGVSGSPFPAGQTSNITINGTGFGTAPTVLFSDPSLTFSPTSVTATAISGTLSVPTLSPPETVTVTVTNTTDGISPAPSGSGIATVVPVQLTTAVTPVASTLDEGQTSQFSATITCRTAGNLPCTDPQTPLWSLSAALGSVTANGLYSAPATISGLVPVQLQVKACPPVNPAQNACGAATVSLIPVVVNVSPTTVALDGGQTSKFNANVSGVPAGGNIGVTWSIAPAVGSVDQTGLYTAPNPVTTAQNITVTACSMFDGSKCGSATVDLTPPSVAVQPSTATVQGDQTFQFSSVVTGIPGSSAVIWSLSGPGTINSTGLYTGPALPIGSAETATVKACSTVLTSICATAAISIPVSPDFSFSAPGSVTIMTGGTFQFDLLLASEANEATLQGPALTIDTSNAPSGVTVTAGGFETARQSIGFNGWPITVTVPSTAAPGTYSFTITGALSNGFGNVVHSITIGLILQQGPTISRLTSTCGTDSNGFPILAPGLSASIIGQGFGASQGSSSVTLGGITATVTSWSSTNIQATVPTNIAPGTALVTVSGATSNGAQYVTTASSKTCPRR